MLETGSGPRTAAASETPAAIAALVENHRRFLAFVERRVGDRAVAEEIVQAAFVRGLERASEIRAEERAIAWFYRLLRNAMIDHWRASAAETRASDALARELAAESTPTPEVETELCRCFEALLPALRPEYAAILHRVDLEGRRPADYARDLGVTANSVMVRLHRARKALRERLQRACRTCAEHGCLDCTCGPAEPGRGRRV